MKWIAIGALFLSLTSFVHAAGSDEQYLGVYNEILEADSLADRGRSEAAATHYLQAQTDLLKLQADHPTWNPDIVKFRLDYLTDKLQGLQKFAPKPIAAPAAVSAASQNAPVVTNQALLDAQAAIAALQQQNAAYQDQIRSLNDANGELQGKLKEALTVQPAAVSPEELAKAEARIVSLQKERDLLSVALAQEKAAHATAGATPKIAASSDKTLTQTRARAASDAKRFRAELAAAKDAAAESEKKLIAANKELQALKDAQAKQAREDAAWQKQSREELDRLRAAKADSDKVIADANKELESLRSAHGPEIQVADETKPIPEQHDQLKLLVAEVARNEAEISQLKDSVANDNKKLASASEELEAVKAARNAAAHDVEMAKSIAAERDRLKESLAERSKDLADAEAHHNKELLKVRAALREAQDRQQEFEKNLAVQSQAAASPQDPMAGLKVERLQARVAVLESEPVPYTREELALMKKTAATRLPVDPPAATVATDPAPAATNTPTTPSAADKIAVETKPRHIYSSSDLPQGAGPIWTEAMRDSMAGNYVSAEQKFKEVLAQDENNVYVLAHLGNAQFSAGELVDCEKSVQHALSIDAEDPGSLFLLGLLRYRQNRLDEAFDALSLSAKYNPTNTTTQNFLGCVLADKGLRRPAETAFRKALLGDPNYADAHFNLAVVYAGNHPPSTELARLHYKKALALGHPKSATLEKMLTENSEPVTKKDNP